MIRRQIISILLFLSSLYAIYEVIIYKTWNHKLYGGGLRLRTTEMYAAVISVLVYVSIVVTGAVLFRKKKWCFWVISWSITGVLAGLLSIYVLVFAANPDSGEFAWLADMGFRYIYSGILAQAGLLLVIVSFFSKQHADVKACSVIAWFGLVFSLIVIVGYTLLWSVPFLIDGPASVALFTLLINTVPSVVIIPILLLRGKRVSGVCAIV